MFNQERVSIVSNTNEKNWLDEVIEGIRQIIDQLLNPEAPRQPERVPIPIPVERDPRESYR